MNRNPETTEILRTLEQKIFLRLKVANSYALRIAQNFECKYRDVSSAKAVIKQHASLSTLITFFTLLMWL